MDNSIRITEVGPRDGLQNQSAIIPTEAKVAFIDLLSSCGVAEIEVSSFVSVKWIPQLGDASEVFARIKRNPNVMYSALVPNMKGMEAALAAAVDKIAIFTSASETFSQKNTNASIDQTLERFKSVIDMAKSQQNHRSKQQANAHAARTSRGLPVRAYISCAVACPYEGPIDPEKVRELAQRLLQLGADEIDVADTIGVATPDDIEKLYESLNALLKPEHTTLHLHDTRGTALACAERACRIGVRSFDSSCAGLGGCPYAPGAAGNVDTGKLTTMFDHLGHATSVDVQQLSVAAEYISAMVSRPG